MKAIRKRTSLCWGMTMSMLLLSAMAFAQDVDLAKRHRADGNPWIGKTVPDVLPVDQIERIVLTRAITSAPPDIDLGNIRRMLDSTRTLQPRSAAASLMPPLGGALGKNSEAIWEALILTRAGEAIRFVADNEWICLIGTAGEGCYRQARD
ncbi:MAG: hypothetical protein IT473_08450 [Lysobacter sp.]|nr:hypothetical protein [Lysobacter sp.]